MTAALLFWGWHTGLWWLALPMAVLAELPGLMHWQWELELKERQRVADLCTVVVVLAGGYLYLNQPRLGVALILLIQWLPALLFPLLAVQLYGRHRGLELSVLFLSLRGDKPGGRETVDLRWAYLLLCVISASMIPPETPWYYPSLALLAAWVLWSRQRAGTSRQRALRLSALALAALLGLGIASALRWGHNEAELIVMRWVEQWLGAGEDPYRSSTAIGDVGTLKGSARIRVRIYPDEASRQLVPGMLLRTASYDRYVDGTWFTSGSPFAPLAAQSGRRIIAAAGEAAPTPRILLQTRRPEGLLPLPAGAAAIDGLAQADLERNGFGTVRYRIRDGAALLDYRVAVDGPPTLAPPDEQDLRIIGPDVPVITRVAAELGLTPLPPAEALRRLRRHFDTEFRYTLELPRIPPNQTPLKHFLTEGRAGHCEYFATAATLLLRQAGIPARYARGWSVQEYSELEGAWIARDSHAHAWVLAWIDGAWRNFDPTPPDWGALEAADRSWTVGVGDFVSWLRLALSGAGDEDRGSRHWLLLPLAMLVLLLAWRIARRARRGARHRRPAAERRGRAESGRFGPLEAAARRLGIERRAGETLREWSERVGEQPQAPGAALRDAVDLHYRDRFDPRGIDPTARERLRQLLDDCLRGMR